MSVRGKVEGSHLAQRGTIEVVDNLIDDDEAPLGASGLRVSLQLRWKGVGHDPPQQRLRAAGSALHGRTRGRGGGGGYKA